MEMGISTRTGALVKPEDMKMIVGAIAEASQTFAAALAKSVTPPWPDDVLAPLGSILHQRRADARARRSVA